MASPFLSNPAATPIGLLILTLKKEVFKNSNFFLEKNLDKKLYFKRSKAKNELFPVQKTLRSLSKIC